MHTPETKQNKTKTKITESEKYEDATEQQEEEQATLHEGRPEQWGGSTKKETVEHTIAIAASALFRLLYFSFPSNSPPFSFFFFLRPQIPPHPCCLCVTHIVKIRIWSHHRLSLKSCTYYYAKNLFAVYLSISRASNRLQQKRIRPWFPSSLSIFFSPTHIKSSVRRGTFGLLDHHPGCGPVLKKTRQERDKHRTKPKKIRAPPSDPSCKDERMFADFEETRRGLRILRSRDKVCGFWGDETRFADFEETRRGLRILRRRDEVWGFSEGEVFREPILSVQQGFFYKCDKSLCVPTSYDLWQWQQESQEEFSGSVSELDSEMRFRFRCRPTLTTVMQLSWCVVHILA